MPRHGHGAFARNPSEHSGYGRRGKQAGTAIRRDPSGRTCRPAPPMHHADPRRKAVLPPPCFSVPASVPRHICDGVL